MKKIFLIVALIGVSIAFQCHAVIFNFKGGAANTIDIALFKHKWKFEDFIEKTGISKDIANTIEAFTQKHSEALGNIIGGVAGGAAMVAATAATGGAAAPVALVAGETIIVPIFQSAAKFGIENYGRVAQLGAELVKFTSKKIYASHYLEDVEAPREICLGLQGERNRLIRSKEILKDDKLMDINNPQPMYLVIFNTKEAVNKKDIEIIRDPVTGANLSARYRVYAKPGEILYAGELPKNQLKSSIDITTHFMKDEAFDDDGTPILDQYGKPLVLERTVGVKFTTVNPSGGIECK